MRPRCLFETHWTENERVRRCARIVGVAALGLLISTSMLTGSMPTRAAASTTPHPKAALIQGPAIVMPSSVTPYDLYVQYTDGSTCTVTAPAVAFGASCGCFHGGNYFAPANMERSVMLYAYYQGVTAHRAITVE